MRILTILVVVLAVISKTVQAESCPAASQVALNGSWNLRAPGWQVASYVGSPGKCVVIDNVAWAPNTDHGLYIQCWYESVDSDGVMMIYRVASNSKISVRYIDIVSPVLCAFANAPSWSQFVDPMTNKTSHLYNCDFAYNSENSTCPTLTSTCFWEPAKTGANVTFQECKRVSALSS